MRIALALFAASIVASACSDSSNGTSDSGEPVDAIDDFDAGVAADARPDAGRVDGGRRDIGFEDPDTVIQGNETIKGLDTYILAQGTLTSTLPPVFMPQGFLNVGSEYLPEHMRFLLPSRLLIYWDMRASGRTSFGDAMTSTVTAAQHVIDFEDLRQYIQTEHGVNTDHIDIVGHGYGAAIGALYTVAHPEHVAHLVMTTPYPPTAHQLALFRGEEQRRLTSQDLTTIHLIQEQPMCRGDRGQCELDTWNIVGAHYLCEANKSLWRNILFEHGSPRSEEFVEQDLRNHRFDWTPQLATIQLPVTIISGDCSPTPAETITTYTSSITGATLHSFSDSGYFPMVEKPDEYQALVKAALRQ